MRTRVLTTSISDNSPGVESRRGARLEVRRAAGRRSFTLTEMLVALAVMILAMAMVTQVFSVTTETAAISSAIADVELQLRNAAEQVRLDLEDCDPRKSVLAIYGRTQAAALTEDKRLAGQYYREMIGDPGSLDGSDPVFSATPPLEYSDPRADIMMFFTNRPCVSQAPPRGLPANDFQRRLQLGKEHSPVQVVYGHAAVAVPVWNGVTWNFPAYNALRHIQNNINSNVLSELPSTRWHLARRQVLVEQTDMGGQYDFGADAAVYDSIRRCCDTSYAPNPTRYAADSVFFDMDAFLKRFQPLAILDNGYSLAERSPYVMPVPSGSAYIPPASTPGWGNTPLQYPLISDIFYGPFPVSQQYNHHVATIVEQPPLDLADNLGLHLLPGCVWFQVEILIPEDPRNSRKHTLSDQRRDTPRWVAVEPGQMYVFVPDTEENRDLVRQPGIGSINVSTLPGGPRISTFAKITPGFGDLDVNYGGGDTVNNRDVRMWPYAIRVTFKAIDRNGRLEKPITRCLVHWFD